MFGRPPEIPQCLQPTQFGDQACRASRVLPEVTDHLSTTTPKPKLVVFRVASPLAGQGALTGQQRPVACLQSQPRQFGIVLRTSRDQFHRGGLAR